TVLLNPPPSKASPGSYDFARDGFFQGVGGSALALKPPAIVSVPDPPWRLGLLMRINAMRWSLGRQIAEVAGPSAAGLAVAMTTGHEAWLPKQQEDALRDAGLAHIISISGLHMAIVGGAVFLAMRLAIAAWPWAALRASGKKVAAGAGLVAVILYAIVSGWPPAAERAALTAIIAFVAILADRRALSFETLAVAALAVTAVQPEAVMQPGFQMSFAATTALIAMAEIWPKRTRVIAVPWPIRMAQNVGVWLTAGIAVSLVAGLATEPFAIQHFNRITLYGIFSNLLTEPLSTLVIMPGLALGAVATPLGLGGPFLAYAGWGLEAMNAIARMFAGFPKAVMVVSSAPEPALAVSFLGLLFICLWRGRLRWIGLPLFAAVAIWPRLPAPVAWIAPGGSNAAVVADGQALVVRERGQRFAADLWSRRSGLAEPMDADAQRSARYDCDRFSCTPLSGPSPRLAIWFGRKAAPPWQLDALCRSADIVVLRAGEASAACDGRLVVGGADLAWGRAAEIRRDGSGWRIAWAEPLHGRRPWSHGQ
ncbi:MAG: ComEC/Rec2 family competence protein, partial [Caulobacteraceae bacterium]